MSTIKMHTTTKATPEQYKARRHRLASRPFEDLRQQCRQLPEGARREARSRPM